MEVEVTEHVFDLNVAPMCVLEVFFRKCKGGSFEVLQDMGV